jgi:hypothetical protein
MFTLSPHLALFANEGLVAIIVSLVGPAVTLWIARWAANRQEHRDDKDDSFRFRGELSTDNQSLRSEVRDLKIDLTYKNDYILKLEEELRLLSGERAVREAADKITGKRELTRSEN